MGTGGNMFNKKKSGELKEIKPINPIIILACIILLAALMTYIIPAGEFDRVAIPDTDYESVVPGSYHTVDGSPVKPFNLFMSLTLGLQDAAYIIFFLLILGGVFKIVEATGALHAGINNLIRATSGKEIALIPISLIIFSLISALAACCEEYLAFMPLMYMVCMASGFDSIMAVCLLFCASAVGYAGGMTQAFSVGVAQTIAELPMFSGIQYRVVVWAVLAIATIAYAVWYGIKIKKDPGSAYNYEVDQKYRADMDLAAIAGVEKISGRQIAVLVLFFGAFIFVPFSVIKWEFYIDEMAAIFVIVGLLVAIVGGLKPNDVADSFIEGAKDMVWAGIIIGMCYAATNIMKDGQIMDTIVNSMGNLLGGTHAAVSASGMFVVQDLFNFLVPSGSGQAAITMPFMAPLADILGVTRQTAVLAFQLGDAFTNVVAPTSGEIMAALAICHVPYSKWFKFIGPLWAIWCVLAIILLVIAVMIGYA